MSTKLVTIITVMNTADTGIGSLRQTIINAIAGDTIIFDSSLSGQVIVLTSGELNINKDLTIDGSALSSRISVSGNTNQRVFNVNNNATVTLRSLTIINGNASDGAGIIVESGSTLNLVNCLLNGNVASNFGGGVYNTGNLSINGCNITNNHAGWGGGVENRQTLTVVDSTFMSNTTSSGGAGVEVYGGTATIARSGFINNVSFNGGNTGSGGGFQSDPGTGDVRLTNDTFSGNQARGGSDDGGGAIMSYGGNLYLSNATLVNNYSATHGGGISTNAGYATAINLNNTIFYNNTSGAGIPDDLFGIFNSQDYNLIGVLTGATLTGVTTHNLLGQNPLLNSLSNNGGSNMSFALLPGSPAIDHIPVGVNGCGSTLVEDQRSQPRPVNYPDNPGGCDIGAFELQNDENFTVQLGDGASQTFGGTLSILQDNSGGNTPGLTTITRIPISSTQLTGWDMPFRTIITGTISSGLDINLSLCYTNWEANLGTNITPSHLELYYRNNTTWERVGADNYYTDPLTGVTCVTKNHVSILGRWTLIDPGIPTSVSLNSFSAVADRSIRMVIPIIGIISASLLALISIRIWKRK